MIELRNICKSFQTGQFKLQALDHIDLQFRPHEFVAVVGESGSGKTTLLNVIGGLLSYDEGELLIHGRSTSAFSQTDWDAYRNNSVGFIFQNYQLIPHLSVLANVEMGMTLSDVSKEERQAKAQELLERVGLKDHMHKKPQQLSGGQMQRVAIARALANDPDIILADEPTGALDSQTSKEILDLLTEISQDKLIVMVTHSIDQAKAYADRIIQFSDGKVIADSQPYHSQVEDGESYELNKSGMSFWNALKLSWQNILTKKVRTAITAFAASIGIFGVAIILALSNGLNQQIENFEENSLAQYPLMIEDQAFAMDNLQNQQDSFNDLFKDKEEFPQDNHIYPGQLMNMIKSLEFTNDISEDYMKHLQAIPTDLLQGVQYKRPAKLQLLTEQAGQVVAVDDQTSQLNALPYLPQANPLSFAQKQYDLLAGEWPADERGLLLVVDNYNQVDQKILDSLGIDAKEDEPLAFDQVLGKSYQLVYNDQFYSKEGDLYRPAVEQEELDQLYQQDKNLDLSIVGIVRPKEDGNKEEQLGGLYYTDALAKNFIADAQQSAIVQDQKEADRNLLTGQAFDQVEEAGVNPGDLTQVSSENMSAPGGGQASPSLVSEDLQQLSMSKEDLLAYLGNDELPQEVYIYPASFESKAVIKDHLQQWNDQHDEDEKVVVTDFAQLITDLSGGLMNAITLVLIAFASISLVVSMLMIGIIIYISVLERTQEIGVLRALGAREKDISRVFNAETFIIGLSSGLLGVGLAYLVSIPINRAIASLTELEQVAHLNPWHSLILIVIALVLTLLGGIIPSRMAAKKDPVEALNGE